MGIFNRFKKNQKKDDSQPAAAVKREENKEEKKEEKGKKEVLLQDKPEAVSVGAAKKDKSESRRPAITGVLLRPIITEKSTSLGILNQYVFAVSAGANKISVAKAIEYRYGIKPLSVNILNYFGKSVHYGRTRGRTSDWRKAIITLPQGKAIDIYEQVK